MEPLTGCTLRRLGWLSLRNAPASPLIMGLTGVTVVCLAVGAALIALPDGGIHPIAAAGVAAPLGSVVLVGLVWFLQRREIRSCARHGGWVVGYFTAESSQLVHPDADGWLLTDHYTAHRGRGEAGPFCRQVFARLAAEADRHHVPIRFDTRVRKLADLYIRDMPGLELIDIRRHRFSPLYLLERMPRPMP